MLIFLNKMSDPQKSYQPPESIEDKLISEFGDVADPKHKKLAEFAKQAQANQTELKKNIDHLQELLDYLRVCIKYQVFDLEATRRENEYLRKKLEERDYGPHNGLDF